MDIDKILEKINNYPETDLEKSIKLFLIKESDSCSDVVLYTPEVSSSVQLDLLEFFTRYFKRSEKMKKKEQVKYDMVMPRIQNQYLISKSSDFEGIEKFIKKFEVDTFLKDIKGIEEQDFFAYAIKVTFLDSSYFCYVGEFTSISKVSKMSIVGNLKDNKLTRVSKNDTFGFNKKISLVIFDKEILINDIRLFEKCCNMEKEFIDKSKKVIKEINSYGVINNIDKLEITCQDDPRIARRLTKMNADPERVKAFFTNVNKVNKVLKSKKFANKFKGISYKNGKLEYDDKYRQQFVTLIADAAYKSIVGGQERIDNSL